MSYERENIRALHAYTPGEQPAEASKVIKLNTNENPYPPCQAVLDAIHAVTAEGLRRYPQPVAQKFRLAAARVHGVTPDHIIATNGGDELLRLAVSVFCDPKPAPALEPPTQSPGIALPASSYPLTPRVGGIGMAEPSYSLYPVLADIHDTLIHRVALNDDWSIPKTFASDLNANGCRLAIIVNPHAPSGRLEPVEVLFQQAREFQGVLMIDEAYVDFAAWDAISLVDAGLSNVILLRSMSKGYSLAGLRFGYGIGHPDLIASLHKAKDSYNTDILSQAAAVAAIENRIEASRTWAAVISERTRLTAELRRRGWLVYPSQSNFILTIPPASGPSARDLYLSLKNANILVRYFDQNRLRDKLRITIGTPAENNALLAKL